MEVGLRAVTRRDWRFILNVRNEREVRLACHDTHKITFSTHRRYMEELDKNPDAYQWIISYNGTNAGHVKIVKGELGYMLKREFRRRGLGAKFHQLVFSEARKLGIKKLRDTIKMENTASLNLALKTGFVNAELLCNEGKPYAYILEKEL